MIRTNFNQYISDDRLMTDKLREMEKNKYTFCGKLIPDRVALVMLGSNCIGFENMLDKTIERLDIATKLPIGCNNGIYIPYGVKNVIVNTESTININDIHYLPDSVQSITISCTKILKSEFDYQLPQYRMRYFMYYWPVYLLVILLSLYTMYKIFLGLRVVKYFIEDIMEIGQ